MFDQEQQNLSPRLIFPRKQNPYLKSFQTLKFIRQISQGSFGKVSQYYNPLKNQFYAVKRMVFNGPNDFYVIKQIKRQIDLLYRTNSPYIIKLLDHFQSPNSIFLITQFIDGNNLCDAILRPKIQLQTKAICLMINDICSGLLQLHSQKIVHRDLKLQNIMISSKGVIKIIDLGQSNFYGEQITRRTTRGTKSYFSPQVANKQLQDDKVDVWCVGVIIYELVCLASPFHARNEKQLMENIRRFRYPIPQKIKYDKDLLDLLSKIFTWNIDRINVIQLKNHPWLKKNIQGQNNIIKFQHFFKDYQIVQYRTFLEQQIQISRKKIIELKNQNKDTQKMIDDCKSKIFKLNKKS